MSLSVYEHAADYLTPLLVWEQVISDRDWTHLAVVYNNKTPALYVNGELVKTGLSSTKPNIHPSGTIGGGDWGYFSGTIANVRVYQRALLPIDLKQVIDADQLALPAYRKGHPIGFSLFDENQNYVLYISDDPKADHALNLELKNTSSQAIQFQSGQATVAALNNYHFELVFRIGTLSAQTLMALRQNKATVLKDPDQWDLFVPPEDPSKQSVSLYFLYKGTDQVFNQNESRLLTLQKMSAAAGSGTRGTQVELKLNQLVYVDDIGDATPPPITGSRVQQLQITNQSGRKSIPLHVGFIGSNRILNDGSPSKTPLRLRITNTSKEPISLKAASFTLSFDIGDEGKEWAIATDADLKPTITAIYPDGTQKEITDVTRKQGVSPAWTIGNATLPIQQLGAGQHIEVSIAGIKTTHPTGYTNLYINYSVPGYWDGQFVCLIEKAPLLFYDASKTAHRVGIGNPNPQNLLHIGSGESTITSNRVSVVIATKATDTGIAIAQQGGNLGAVNLLLQASTAGGYIGTTSNHPLVLRTNDADRLVVNNDGNVIIHKDLQIKGDIKLGDGGNLFAWATSQKVRIVMGSVERDGKPNGTGFISERTGVGQYSLKFTPAFSQTPVILTGAGEKALPIVYPNVWGDDCILIYCRNLFDNPVKDQPTDARFYFLAIGS